MGIKKTCSNVACQEAVPGIGRRRLTPLRSHTVYYRTTKTVPILLIIILLTILSLLSGCDANWALATSSATNAVSITSITIQPTIQATNADARVPAIANVQPTATVDAQATATAIANVVSMTLAADQASKDATAQAAVEATVEAYAQSTQAALSTQMAIDQDNARTTAQAADAARFSGHWVTNFGSMDLVSNGTDVTGLYYDAFLDENKPVSGTVSGNILDGTFPEGTVHWVLDGSGNTFDGNFNGWLKWCGAREGVPFPTGCSFAGSWMTGHDSENAYCNMELTLIDTIVTGTACNDSINGAVTYWLSSDGPITILSGYYYQSSGPSLRIHFYLLGQNALQFQGNYDNFYPWCGARTDQQLPTPCLRQ